MVPGASSRVFIKNLPSTLSQDDFRKHFSYPAPITDAKLLPQRRIGYVGYKTDEDAAKAVAYFNKSFMGMARLKVELAHSVEDLEKRQTKRERRYGSEGRVGMDPTFSSNGQRSGSDTLSHPDPSLGMNKESKLDDFLQVMQAPSQSKVWENQDGRNESKKAPADSVQRKMPEPEADSDTDCQHVSKKARKAKPQILETESKLLSPPKTPVETPDSETETPYADNKSSTQGLGQEPTATSDTEWRRSRTSRLLGLLDDEEMLEGEASDTEKRNSISGDNNATDLEPLVRKYESSPVARAGSALNEKPSSAGVEHDVEPDVAIENGRLFIRNLTYTGTSEDLRHHFAAYGYQDLVEIHLPRDTRNGDNKGYAHVQLQDPSTAVNALRDLDQKPFQGRLLHVLPSNDKRANGLDDFAVSKLPLKKQQQMRRKAEAASSTFNWNSMYMSTDAVMSSVSNRLKVSKSSLLDPTSSSAAVKQALAETHIVQETKQYFKSNGVDLDAFKDSQRGDTAILVKNFPHGTKPEELKQLFETYGALSKLLMPPSGTIAIVAFLKAEHAKSAFGALAYRRFKDSLLFLEKAPRNLFEANGVTPNVKTSQVSAGELLHGPSPQDLTANTSTLFVRNLNFATTREDLQETFKPLSGFLSARVKTKTDPKKPGQVLSMGFGFLEFRSKRDAENALGAMDGYDLNGHQLLIRESNKAVDAAEARRREEQAKKMAGRKTKIIIKNLPFEASKSDIRSLFGAYGKLRSVRVPKKFDSSTRGFAFADFITPKEAENALDALRDTHLLGRRLVLEFAAEEAVDPEEEIERMQGKISKQSDKVALQQLIAGSARQKFNVEGDDQDS